jgi:hypothetical protein
MPFAADTELSNTNEWVASTETSPIGFHDEIGSSPLLIRMFSPETPIWKSMNLRSSSSPAVGGKVPVER